jgi:hypothetical protein
MRKMRYLLIIVALVALVAGWTAFWWQGAGLLRERGEAWFAARRAAGWQAEHDGVAVDGFPFRLILVAREPRLAEPGAWSWSAPRLRVVLQPWNPRHFIAEIDGPQRLTLGSHGAGIDADSVQASIMVGHDDRLDTVILVLRQGRAEVDGLPLAADWVQLAVRERPGDDGGRRLDLALDAEALLLPPTAEGPLGRQVGRLAIVGRMPARWPGGPLRAAVEAWRADGGAIDLPTIRLNWGPVDAQGDATVTVDRDLRPEGAGSFAVKGLDQLVDALARGGQLKAGDVALARGAAMVMTATGARLPLSAQMGRLYLGPLPVATLAPLL